MQDRVFHVTFSVSVVSSVSTTAPPRFYSQRLDVTLICVWLHLICMLSVFLNKKQSQPRKACNLNHVTIIKNKPMRFFLQCNEA